MEVFDGAFILFLSDSTGKNWISFPIPMLAKSFKSGTPVPTEPAIDVLALSDLISFTGLSECKMGIESSTMPESMTVMK
jgi:hypothetical protein